MMRNLKKNRKKGFTLVELIVVLVILAILAALLIPALTGYIDKAKDKQVIAETRQAVMAAQTLVDEKYANKDKGADITVSATGDVKYTDIQTLGEVKGTISDVDVTEGVVTTLKYANKGKTCTYTSAPASGDEQYEIQ